MYEFLVSDPVLFLISLLENSSCKSGHGPRQRYPKFLGIGIILVHVIVCYQSILNLLLPLKGFYGSLSDHVGYNIVLKFLLPWHRLRHHGAELHGKIRILIPGANPQTLKIGIFQFNSVLNLKIICYGNALTINVNKFLISRSPPNFQDSVLALPGRSNAKGISDSLLHAKKKQ